ncbi:MAG: hypothetical protein AUH42_00235 [Gemmatimonadetes bacterium 13_1_40CM_70_11]|nr:MAG: hypothetical protein AUH42_00235 [Gemmatimonadetes bacterium 13_1_40CM_70_11]
MAAHERNTLPQDFVAHSTAMVDVLRGVDRYARARTPLVLVGASGTGKTTLAELIHAMSGRSGAFSAHTAREFDRELERSQIFGHERGAFTGAADRHVGVLEEAAEGTLLLDDVHHLRRSTQTLFLRALDRWVFRRLGGSRDLPVRCRVIVGFTEGLDTLVKRKGLLAELRFRLGYSLIRVPPLAERREDIPGLADHFLRGCPATTDATGPTRLALGVVSVLQAADWPGNVRQLAMVIREAYLRAQGSPVLRVDHLADLVAWPVQFARRGGARMNRQAIELALDATRGNADAAATLLHTTRSTVYRYRPAVRARSVVPPVSDSPARTRESDTRARAAGFDAGLELPAALISQAVTSPAVPRGSLSDSPPQDGESDATAAAQA